MGQSRREERGQTSERGPRQRDSRHGADERHASGRQRDAEGRDRALPSLILVPGCVFCAASRSSQPARIENRAAVERRRSEDGGFSWSGISARFTLSMPTARTWCGRTNQNGVPTALLLHRRGAVPLLLRVAPAC